MKNIIYISIICLATLSFFSCKTEHSEIGQYEGKGYLVSKDVAEVVEDYLSIATMGLAIKTYAAADTEEKIRLERTTLFKHTIRPVGHMWEITPYSSRQSHYVEVVYEADWEVSRINITRASGWDDNGKPLFDSCRLTPAGSDLWDVAWWETRVGDRYYNRERIGEAEMKLSVILFEDDMPDIFWVEGTGNYTSTDFWDSSIELDWEITRGNYLCFGTVNDHALESGNLFIKSGKKNGTKDNIRCDFDREARRTYIEVNGIKEDHHSAF